MQMLTFSAASSDDADARRCASNLEGEPGTLPADEMLTAAPPLNIPAPKIYYASRGGAAGAGRRRFPLLPPRHESNFALLL